MAWRKLTTLRACASDSRWRLREGVAIALQHWGDVDFNALMDEMENWCKSSLFEQRAAALCEPRLLKDPAQVQRVLNILDSITASIPRQTNRKAEDFIALRKGLAYCWSVAVAAYPEVGKKYMEKWLTRPRQYPPHLLPPLVTKITFISPPFVT
jgi:hypothetical protein